jgi:hypothetical protein
MQPNSADELVSKLTALRMSPQFSAAEQRFAARLGAQAGSAAEDRLKEAGDWLAIGAAARVLGCSKSTIRKYLSQKILLSRDVRGRRTGRKRQRISAESIRDLIHVCQKRHQFARFSDPRRKSKRQSFLEQFKSRTSSAQRRGIPGKLTISDTAHLLQCSAASVVRMIRRDELWATRRTPHRWIIFKESFR